MSKTIKTSPNTTTQTQNSRYSKISIILHWSIAAAIIAMLISGLLIHYDVISNKGLEFILYQWHKSLGVFILLATAFRMLWRLTHKAPAIHELSHLEQIATKLGHIALYIIAIAVLMSGWTVVSSNTTGIPTLIFDRINWPHLPVINDEALYSQAKNIHFISALALLTLITGHILMVIKHQRHNITLLERMPFNRTSRLAIILLASVFISYTVFSVYAQKNTPTVTNNSNQGIIQFKGIQSGTPFTGTFTDWELETDFDPQSGNMTIFNLRIKTASASTNNNYHDSILKESDWFSVKEFPIAHFSSLQINRKSSNHYEVKGSLTIKNITHSLNFELVNSEHSLNTSFALYRLKFNIGKETDPEANWVSNDIQIYANVKK